MTGIYIIYNDINDKVYIGQSKNIQYRWYAHRSEVKQARQLYKNGYTPAQIKEIANLSGCTSSIRAMLSGKFYKDI